MDPLTAFAAAQAAVKGIKAAVSLYKDAKGAAHDVGDIAFEVSGFLGQFFSAQEAVVKASNENHTDPASKKSIDAQAMDNIMRIRQLQQYEQELKELLIYHTPMAGVWEDFQAERNRLRAEERKRKLAEEKAISRAKQKRQEFVDECVFWVVIAAVVLSGCFALYMFFDWLIEQGNRPISFNSSSSPCWAMHAAAC